MGVRRAGGAARYSAAISGTSHRDGQGHCCRTMSRTYGTHLPHWGAQPSRAYTFPAEPAPSPSARRICLSVRALQMQTYMKPPEPRSGERKTGENNCQSRCFAPLLHDGRSEEPTSELQSLLSSSYAVFG